MRTLVEQQAPSGVDDQSSSGPETTWMCRLSSFRIACSTMRASIFLGRAIYGSLATICFAQGIFAQEDTSIWTSRIPLAMRSPYLETFMNGSNVPFNLSDVYGTVQRAPNIWSLTIPIHVRHKSGVHCRLSRSRQQSGWAGLIRIDSNNTYKWFGDPLEPDNVKRVVLTNIDITPTRTIMNVTAGPIDLDMTLLSPIEVRCFFIQIPLYLVT